MDSGRAPLLSPDFSPWGRNSTQASRTARANTRNRRAPAKKPDKGRDGGGGRGRVRRTWGAGDWVSAAGTGCVAVAGGGTTVAGAGCVCTACFGGGRTSAAEREPSTTKVAEWPAGGAVRVQGSRASAS